MERLRITERLVTVEGLLMYKDTEVNFDPNGFHAKYWWKVHTDDGATHRIFKHDKIKLEKASKVF